VITDLHQWTGYFIDFYEPSRSVFRNERLSNVRDHHAGIQEAGIVLFQVYVVGRLPGGQVKRCSQIVVLIRTQR